MTYLETASSAVRPAEDAFTAIADAEREIAKVIVGQDRLIRRLLTGLLAAIPYASKGSDARFGCGHVLLEGVPGVAKTLLATTVAHVVSARFQRIQMTADMLPADIIGTRVYEAQTATFRVERGPVFTNILLADEINRATPKAQSALLEAMQERQVTIAEATYRLEDPFWALATQNPVEQEGVYALPEAQLDRFSMMLAVGYPDLPQEVAMLGLRFDRLDLQPRLVPADVMGIADLVRRTVYADDRIKDYIVRIGRATRAPDEVGRPDLKEMLLLGISPRSCQHILALARVTAFLHGRDYVLPRDVREIVLDATRHRIARTVRAQAENVGADAIVHELVAAVPISRVPA